MILTGDCRETLKTLPAQSVHCVVTSPPYWGLRDYGVDGQLGLEPTPAAYVANMLAVFAEVWRVLRDDGTVWLNVGDSYCSGGRDSFGPCQPDSKQATHSAIKIVARAPQPPGLKPKDLVGIPWMLAFALRDAGWYLRQDIIWAKPAPMPESVRDRCTKAHEYLFLLTKNQRYYYDADAIREPILEESKRRASYGFAPGGREDDTIHVRHGDGYQRNDGSPVEFNPAGRNRRSVWTIASQGFPDAHFATYPPAIVEPCILAGTSAKGVCAECGAPWRRVTERRKLTRERPNSLTKRTGEDGTGNFAPNDTAGVDVVAVGWQPTCKHAGEPVPATVLDPFFGAGTTGLVSQRLGRKWIGCELSEAYADMSRRRIRDDAPLFSAVNAQQENTPSGNAASSNTPSSIDAADAPNTLYR